MYMGLGSVTVCWQNSSPKCSSACRDQNREVWSYYTSTASTITLASGALANHLQVGYDYLQVPSWSGAVLPGWRVHPRFVGRRQVAVAVGWQWDTLLATYQDYDRSTRLCCVWPDHMQLSPRRTADFITQKNPKLICSAASAFNWRYINMRIHSFIHSNVSWHY